MLIQNYLCIGNNFSGTFNNVICDTNFHYMVDAEGNVARKYGSVIIGNDVWTGNNCSIVKGAVLPDNAIVSAKSYVNKDFSEYTGGVLLVGSPAKVKRVGVRSIFNWDYDAKFNKYFKEHTDAVSVKYSIVSIT